MPSSNRIIIWLWSFHARHAKGKIAKYSNFSSIHGAFNLHLLEYTKITKPNLAQSLKNAFLGSSQIVFLIGI